MSSRAMRMGVLLGAAALLVAASGCSKDKVLNPKANQRPTIELTRAPFNESTRFEYQYRMNWLGYDPDGRVEYYLYAVDPPRPTPLNPEPETTWVQTDKSERVINFSATQIDTTDGPQVDGSQDFHTFVVKAIDNGGLGGPLQSKPLVRSFFTYTIAPTCQILDPPPSDRSRTYVTPSVRITWTGTDEDGITDNKKPVKYKYILLTQNSEVPFQVALNDPDSVRRYYAPRNWAGWDSTSADTTTHQFTNLVPSADYMFCVVSFDEAGAYSPQFDLNTNMLNMRITFAATGGPRLTVFNEFFFYEYPAPVYSDDPQFQIKIEIPADELVTFRWIGVPGPGAITRGYRWALDIDDLSDQTPRNPERSDFRHWSQEADVTEATVGPFGGGETHFFYIEAIDNNGLRSLGTVNFSVVQSTLGTLLPDPNTILIVDDTRYFVDTRIAGSPNCIAAPTNRFPMAAELDTFLYARGGQPYKCYPAGSVSRPGIFNGYPFDTVGTRVGLSEVRVPLAKLGQYKYVIWLTDAGGANKDNPGTDVRNSITALRYMSSPGRANSLAAYIKQGGEVWMVGGGCAFATTHPYNKPTNDTSPPAAGTTYSALVPSELVPGRFMYDLANWQSEIKVAQTPMNSLTRMRGRHDSLGTRPPGATPPEPRPEYDRFPLTMRLKSEALGDSVPPYRTSRSDFFYNFFDFEYMSQPNRILEDIDPSLLGFNEQSTLDTLYYVRGPAMVQPSFNLYNVCMTRYVGPRYTRPILFTGFNIWSFSRVDCISMVDAVLQDLWQIPRNPGATRLQSSASRSIPQAWTPGRLTASADAPTPVRTARGSTRAASNGR